MAGHETASREAIEDWVDLALSSSRGERLYQSRLRRAQMVTGVGASVAAAIPGPQQIPAAVVGAAAVLAIEWLLEEPIHADNALALQAIQRSLTVPESGEIDQARLADALAALAGLRARQDPDAAPGEYGSDGLPKDLVDALAITLQYQVHAISVSDRELDVSVVSEVRRFNTATSEADGRGTGIYLHPIEPPATPAQIPDLAPTDVEEGSVQLADIADVGRAHVAERQDELDAELEAMMAPRRRETAERLYDRWARARDRGATSRFPPALLDDLPPELRDDVERRGSGGRGSSGDDGASLSPERILYRKDILDGVQFAALAPDDDASGGRRVSEPSPAIATASGGRGARDGARRPDRGRSSDDGVALRDRGDGAAPAPARWTGPGEVRPFGPTDAALRARRRGEVKPEAPERVQVARPEPTAPEARAPSAPDDAASPDAGPLRKEPPAVSRPGGGALRVSIPTDGASSKPRVERFDRGAGAWRGVGDPQASQPGAGRVPARRSKRWRDR